MFVVWLAGKKLGTESNAQFAEAIGKGAPQLSRWAREDPRPSWESIKTVADAVGINAVWLDDPSRPDALEPPDFAEWIAARRERERRADEKRTRKKARGA